MSDARNNSKASAGGRSHAGVLAAAGLLGFVIVLSGCTDVVFRDRELFEAPPDTVNNFLGYFDTAEKTPVCGNCHVGKTSGWRTTGHAEAWAGLQASGGAQAFCEGCHSVSQLGNAIDNATNAGYNLVADERYQDVQCESCHGPGLEHVLDPDALTKPLAPISAGVDLGTGCGDCHEDTHHPFVEQWQMSRHGTPTALSYAGGRETCAPCHEGRTALAQKFGEGADYIEKDDTEKQPLVCVVCHDPHGSPNENNLRAPIDVATTDHLCVTCHSRVGTPPSSHGPHAAQGLLVLGVNVGWIPPNFVYDTTTIIGTHGSTANPKLCVTCHVDMFTVTDAATGDFVLSAVGHTFEAIPCLDASGIPTTGECEVTERTFNACATAGCHATEAIARSLFTVVKGRMNFLLDQLWFDTDGNSVIDATDAGLLPKVVAQGDATQIDVSDQTTTVAEGALWNAMLAYTHDREFWSSGEAFGVHFSAHKASGEGVHNPFLLEALLTSSIQAVIDAYGLTSSPGLDLAIQSTPPPGLRQQ